MKFKEHLLSLDSSLKNVPNGYKRLGDFMMLRSSHQLSAKLGEVIMQSYSWCRGVYQYIATEGETRQPKIIHLAGDKNTETTHLENGVKYVLDIQQVMFSGGNSQLRRSLVDMVANGENLLDMFCAVGNLSMQVLVHKKVNAILVEKSFVTFEYLIRTLQANHIEGYKTLNIDCRDLQIDDWADRIFMGYHDVDKSHLLVAVKAAKSHCKIHLHPIAPFNDYQNVITQYTQWFEELGVKIIEVNSKKVKDYSPKLHHIQVIYSIEK